MSVDDHAGRPFSGEYAVSPVPELATKTSDSPTVTARLSPSAVISVCQRTSRSGGGGGGSGFVWLAAAAKTSDEPVIAATAIRTMAPGSGTRL